VKLWDKKSAEEIFPLIIQMSYYARKDDIVPSCAQLSASQDYEIKNSGLDLAWNAGISSTKASQAHFPPTTSKTSAKLNL
jgi:hypothetical protein